ncbi:MAG: fused MFS/spermidine synthase, partial [Desulfovibrionales bacterium]
AVADRYPSFRVLSMILFGASVFVLVLPPIHLPLSRLIVALDMEFRISVLLASIVFFLPASVLMGMVSPYIIKLTLSELRVVGQTAGNIYSVSTMGSIAGTLGVSFFLIPMIGTRAIILLAGSVLICCGLLCLFAHQWLISGSENRLVRQEVEVTRR